MSIDKVTCFVTRRIDGQDHFAPPETPVCWKPGTGQESSTYGSQHDLF